MMVRSRAGVAGVQYGVLYCCADGRCRSLSVDDLSQPSSACCRASKQCPMLLHVLV
jgi:hypothetical protein